MSKGKIYLIPIQIADDNLQHIPPIVIHRLHTIMHLAAERVRTARRFISKTKPPHKIDSIKFTEITKKEENFNDVWKWIEEGHDVGILSESGMPGIADPGQKIVHQAHQKDIRVIPLTGPSSIFLALSASGMNGQSFKFHGYLPIKENQLNTELKKLEKRILSSSETQIFIETPYRNDRLLKSLSKTLNQDIRLCVAADITGENEMIKTMPLKSWSQSGIEIGKRPCIFLLSRS